MEISRRQFLALCSASSLVFVEGMLPTEADALPAGSTKVIWLHGASCTGCSVSFLNRISATAPAKAADVLLNIVELDYHSTLMAGVGETAALAAQNVYNAGGYVLVVEGGIPTAFQGAACWVWSLNGKDVTMQEAVTQFASRAKAVVCVGSCASWGGVPSAPPNPTGIKGVKALTGKPTINIAGCPPHPDWIVWAIAQLVMGAAVPLDTSGRPKALYGTTVHDRCPRRETEEASTYGIDRRCLKEIGCRGPETRGGCPTSKWNGGVNWCVDANAPCIGCTEPTFPMVGLLSGEGD